MYATSIDTPIGTLWLTGSDAGLRSIDFTDAGYIFRGEEHLADAASQLQDYFAGNLQRFELKLDLSGTSFQCSVWSQMRQIEYGTTQTYSGLAEALKKPKAVRAVGRCCALNPIPFVIPCHRVLGRDQSLTGYRGGIDVKRFVLELEGCL